METTTRRGAGLPCVSVVSTVKAQRIDMVKAPECGCSCRSVKVEMLAGRFFSQGKTGQDEQRRKGEDEAAKKGYRYPESETGRERESH